MLLLDESYPIPAHDWYRLTTFVRRLVDVLRRRDVARRVGVVTYSTRVVVDLPPGNHHLDAFTSLPYTPVQHGRNISGALRLTRTEVQVLIMPPPPPYGG